MNRRDLLRGACAASLGAGISIPTVRHTNDNEHDALDKPCGLPHQVPGLHHATMRLHCEILTTDWRAPDPAEHRDARQAALDRAAQVVGGEWHIESMHMGCEELPRIVIAARFGSDEIMAAHDRLLAWCRSGSADRDLAVVSIDIDQRRDIRFP